MIRRRNFSGLNTPQLFATLANFTVPAVFMLDLANGQKIRARWLADSIAVHIARWIITPQRAWRIRRVTVKRADHSEVVYYHAGDEQWVSASLPPHVPYIADFDVTDLPELEDHGYEKCNFMQPQPVDVGGLKRGVRLFPGDDTPRSFTKCNLTNCEPPPGSTIVDCNTAMVVYGDLVTTEETRVDGVLVGEVETRRNIAYGRRLPDGTYDDKPMPVTVKVY